MTREGLREYAVAKKIDRRRRPGKNGVFEQGGVGEGMPRPKKY